MLRVFAEEAAQAAGQQQPSGPMGMLMSLMPMILLIVVFYFILIRPQKKKEKETKNMLANLKVGDQITTIGGIVGTVARIKDEKIVVESGTNSEKQLIMMERWAVRSVEKTISAD